MGHKDFQKRTYVSFDWAIKRLLRKKADFTVLEGFLSVLLKKEVKVESLLESESNREAADDKMVVVDVLCKLDNGDLKQIHKLRVAALENSRARLAKVKNQEFTGVNDMVFN
ncbi:hypothetical protein B9T16_28730 [Arthrospira sp. PCC 8006]|uniref:PD-(D/E)XK nuclease family transposase n=1 Tax=Arthrospira sp. PCC 8006 TaxID=1982224 RepID=UPI00396DBF8B